MTPKEWADNPRMTLDELKASEPHRLKQYADVLIMEIAVGETADCRDCLRYRRPEIVKSIAKAIAAERSACAKIAHDASGWCRSLGSEETAEQIAVAIRARGETTL